MFSTNYSRFIADCKAELNDSGRSSLSSEQKVLVDRFKLNIRYNVTIESALDSSYAYLSVIEQKSEYENLQESCETFERPSLELPESLVLITNFFQLNLQLMQATPEPVL